MIYVGERKLSFFLFMSAILLMSTILFVTLVARPKAKDSFDSVAIINAQPIDKREFYLVMSMNRSSVEQTLETLKMIKVWQLAAIEFGLTDSISYMSFVVKLDVENKRRLKAKKAGQPIYGPEQYEPEIYYRYLNDLYRNEIGRFLEKRNPPSDEELQSLYDVQKDRFFRISDVYHVVLIQLDEQKNTQIDDQQRLEAILKSSGNLQELELAALNQGIPIIRKVLGPTTAKQDRIRSPLLMQVLEKLKSGDKIPLIREGGEFTIGMVESLKDGGYKGFEDVREQLLVLRRENLLQDFLNEKLKTVIVNPDIEALDRIKMEGRGDAKK